MAKYELKTKKNNSSVAQFLNAIEDEQKRRDAKTVDKMMRAATGEKPKMWGSSIVGYGSYHYVYASGQEGDWMMMGFSPRKATLTLYFMNGFKEYDELLKKLGKYKTGKSCLYVRKLEDIDLKVLEKMIKHSVKYMKKEYGAK